MSWLGALLVGSIQVHAETWHVIVAGSGGEPEYQEQFRDWAQRLEAALTALPEVGAPRVTVLAETLPDAPALGAAVNRDAALEAIRALSGKADQADDVYLYLIGHGAFIKNESQFHVPGPDLSPQDLDEALDALGAARTIVLNATSASAGFINVLSGPNRVICTATKSVTEVNATRFIEHFIQGLEDGSADRNHDERISFLEACEHAAEQTAGWYTSEGLIATEHAILDDNADGLGSRLPLAGSDTLPADTDPGTDAVDLFDGALASQCFLKNFSFAPNVPEELIARYLGILEEVEALKQRKTELDEADYYEQLETLLVSAARTNREIHDYEQATPESS